MKIQKLLAVARRDGRTALDERAAKQILAHYGLRVPKSAVAANPKDVAKACKGLTPPLAVKVMSPDILHKSDAGGVKVNVTDAAAVEAAIEAMSRSPSIEGSRIDGYLIEEMAPSGQEVVIGGVRDPQFGPMVMVGLGGVFVEIMADVSFRLCPITALDAREMLDELRGVALLRGARGAKPVSEDAIIDALLKVGGVGGLLLDRADDIAEADINPLIVSETGATAVDARLILTENSTAGSGAGGGPPKSIPLPESFAPLFTPKTVAVIGASSTTKTIANTFIRRLSAFDFKGRIYPIHPKAPQIEALPAYPSLADTPQPVDYAFIAVGGRQISDLLRAAKGRVTFAQVISAGFAEIEDGVALQAELVQAARDGGCRLLGPNCLGIYSPKGRLTFTENPSADAGPVGIISQSGGLGTDIIRRGQIRGVRFSGAVTIGNSADLGPSDLLEYYLADPDTRVIGIYIEDVKDGRRFANILRRAKAEKPVVLLKGGRTRQGGLAAASHTGALAGDDRPWVALSKQMGCVLTDSLVDFIDVLAAFQGLTPRPERPTQRVVLFGNGGGTSVLASDCYARHGLEVMPLPDKTLAALRDLGLPPGSSIVNPIDTPVGTLVKDDGRIAEKIIELVFAEDPPDALVMHLNLSAFLGRSEDAVLENLMQAALRVRSRYPGRSHFMLVLRSDGDPELDARKRDFRARATAESIVVYDELADAALALAALRHIEQFRRNHPD